MRFPVGLADVPVQPGSDEARRLASDELAKSVYQDARPGLAQSLLEWVVRTVNDVLHSLTGPNAGVGIAVLALAVAALLYFSLRAARPRVRRRPGADAAPVFSGPQILSADAHRRLAAGAARAEDFATAIAEEFRAMVRSAEERAVLPAEPGWTADEVRDLLERVFPADRAGLRAASALFNTVRYGSGAADAHGFAVVVAADTALQHHRPDYAHALDLGDGVPR